MTATIRSTCTSIFSAVVLLAALSSAMLVRGATPLPEPPPQSRPVARVNGDVNGDGLVDISDAVRFLSWKFLGAAEPALLGCEVLRGQNGDVNGDGALEISDAIYLLSFLFSGGPAPACGCGEPVSRDPDHDDEDDSSSLRFLDNQSAVQEVDAIPQHVVLRGRPQPVYSVRIHAIRTANTDGTQAATITPAQIKLLVDQANVVYYSAGIEFQFDPETEFEHRDSYALNHFFTVLADPASYKSPDEKPPTDDTVHTTYRKAVADLHRGQIVVYFSWGDRLKYDEDKGHWVLGPSTGGSSSWAARYVNMPRGMPEKNLLAHEVGHYLHNRHPFVSGVKTLAHAQKRIRDYVELGGHPIAEGLDALDGDRTFVLDTPADVAGSLWVDQGLDRCGAVDHIDIPVLFSGGQFRVYRLEPDRENIMSYFKDCHQFDHHLSPQQISRTRDGLENGDRFDLISPAAGALPLKLTRMGSGELGPVDEIDVVRIGLHRLVTTTLTGSTLAVTSWDVEDDGMTVTPRAAVGTGPASEVASCNMGLGMVATAVRDSGGNLKVIVWKVQPGGAIVRTGDASAGPATQIAACPVGIEYLATASRDASGNLSVTFWHLTAQGTVERRGSAHAGQVSQIAASSVGNFSIATAVRDSEGNLKLIVWQASPGGEEVFRRDSGYGGEVSAIEAMHLDIDLVTTAVRTAEGTQKVIAWRVNEYGQVMRGGSAETGPVLRLSSCRLGVDQLVTAARNGAGNLELHLWEVAADGSSVAHRAEAGAGGMGAVSACQVGTDMVATAVRTLTGNLKIIVWKRERILVRPPFQNLDP